MVAIVVALVVLVVGKKFRSAGPGPKYFSYLGRGKGPVASTFVFAEREIRVQLPVHFRLLRLLLLLLQLLLLLLRLLLLVVLVLPLLLVRRRLLLLTMVGSMTFISGTLLVT